MGGPSQRAGPGAARLIAINRWFPPDPAPTGRLLADLVGHLSTLGLPVIVIAGRPAAPPERGLPGVHLRGVPVPSDRGGLVGRALASLCFTVGATVRLARVLRPGDTVLVETDPPLVTVPATAVARWCGATTVNWCQDLYPEVATAVGLVRGDGLVAGTLRRVRDRALAAARLNVVISRAMGERLRAAGVPAERVAMIPNWADEAGMARGRAEACRRRLGFEDDHFVVGYAGTLGRIHDPAPLAELVRASRDLPEIRFLFLGRGVGMARLRDALDDDDLGGRTRFLAPCPRRELGGMLRAVDLHLVGLRPACEGLSFPSKLYGVLAAGRPVLFVGDPMGETARIVVSAGAGLAVDGSDPMATLEAVLTLRRQATRRGRMARQLMDRRYRKSRALAAWTHHLGLTAPAVGAPATSVMVGGTGIEPVTPRV